VLGTFFIEGADEEEFLPQRAQKTQRKRGIML